MAAPVLAANALLDLETFYVMYQQQVNSSYETDDGGPVDEFVIRSINAASTTFEKFCNRRLKAQYYSYDPADALPIDDQDPNEDNIVYLYDTEYSIFDPPKSNRFWFPTYPINSINIFSIRDVVVSPSTDYFATDGYILYKNTGLLVYDQGFDYGYYRCVKVKWNGGYLDGSDEMYQLQHLLFQAVKTIISAPENPLLQSETIGSYQYQNYSGFVLNSLKAYSPEIFVNLGRYRRESIG
jgi:hypothetical protein